ncbi:Protein vip1 [Vermiconidia calcicola]|uniref:Protein vip1 n=1 Tax=Vermiconidia calcicola TaxID=1690605 RepID=A0ACC3N4W6_9PEZI|nr:Protein vip1 [Vermiconidia calcicola]
MSNTVHVKGISSQTSEKEVRDFFSFCGKIQSLSVTPESNDPSASQSASVTFEKETAAKTALLLDNTQLGPAQVQVSSAASLDQIAGGKTAGSADEPHDKEGAITQEDKPRSRILAEYLANGYVVSDKAIERAINLDQQHGVSNRFMATLQGFDSKYKVSEKSAQMDEKYGVSSRAQAGWMGLTSYFEKAANTPTGQRLRSFYEQGSKQVLDVHNEAKHLASLKTGKSENDVANPAVAATSASGASMPTPEQAEMEKVNVDGQEKTKCNCGGADGKCPCEPGKCACEGCGKKST